MQSAARPQNLDNSSCLWFSAPWERTAVHSRPPGTPPCRDRWSSAPWERYAVHSRAAGSSREKGGSGPARSIPFLLLPFGSPPLKLPLPGLELIRSTPVGAVRGRGLLKVSYCVCYNTVMRHNPNSGFIFQRALRTTDLLCNFHCNQRTPASPPYLCETRTT